MNLTPEQKESINKHITEVIFGECWHKWDKGLFITTADVHTCIKCGAVATPTNIAPKKRWDYCTSWDAFRRLMEKMQARRDDIDFLRSNLTVYPFRLAFEGIPFAEINNFFTPGPYALAVAKWTGWKEDGE